MQAFLAPVDFMQAPEYRQLERAGHAGRWWRLVEIAKRAGFRGCVVRSYGAQTAVDANWLAEYSADGDEAAWVDFLDRVQQLGLVDIDKQTQAYRVLEWSSFHRPPSHTPEGERERKADQRAKERNTQKSPNLSQASNLSQVSQDVPSVPTDRIGSDRIGSSSSGGGLEEGEEDFRGRSDADAPPDRNETPQALVSALDPGLEPSEIAGIGLSKNIQEQFAQLRGTGRLTQGERSKLGGWCAEMIHQRAPAAAILQAATAAVEQTRFESAQRDVHNPVLYAVSLLENHYDRAFGTHQANQVRAQIGLSSDSVYTWEPPEPGDSS